MQFLEKLEKDYRKTTERRINYLVSEPNYHTKKFFTENLLAKEMTKTQILTNKPVHLGLSRLDVSNTVIYKFWYNYVKPKFGKHAILCYVDTDIFIVHVKTEHIYKDIVEDAETRFDTANYELDRPLSKGKIKKSSD